MTLDTDPKADFNPDLLHRFALFSRLASDERALLARCMRRRAFRAGQTLTTQGVAALKFYCILSGDGEVIVRYAGTDKDEKVATIALQETYTLEGDVQSMLALFDRQPELGKKVYKALSKQLVKRVQEMNKNLFYLL